VIGSCQFYIGFIFDPFGWPLIDYNPGLSDGWQIPVYPELSHLNHKMVHLMTRMFTCTKFV